MSVLLALDTSGTLISLALKKPDGSVVSYEVDGAGAASVSLIDELAAFVAREGVEARSVGTFVVGIGPGSFTGVRLALSVAKGWCSASGCRLVGVESLVGMVWGQSVSPGNFVALADARRGEFFCSFFTGGSGTFNQQGATQLVKVESVGGVSVSGPTVVVAELSIPPALLQGLPSDWNVIRARNIACGLLRAYEGENASFSAQSPSEIACVEPLYVREVAAKTVEERKNPT